MFNRELSDGAILGTYERTAEIQLQQLNVRLSYHDWLMFQTILESFPRQAQEAFSGRGAAAIDDPKKADTEAVNIEQQVSKLADLGFSKQDCRKALDESEGQLNEAALWLTQHAVANSASSSSSEAVAQAEDPDNSRTIQNNQQQQQNYYLQVRS